MDERLRSGLRAAAGFGLDFVTKKNQIEAKTQFELGATSLAAAIDSFNAELDLDPDYNSYNEKWAKKLPELQKMVANTKNPMAKKELELYLDTMNTRQGVVIEGKANTRLMKDAYVTRTTALDQRLQQTAIPTAAKMQDIEGTIQGLYQDGVIDKPRAADMMASLGGIVAGRDLKSQAMNIFRTVEAEQGGEAALNAADRFIQEFGEAYTVGGQTVSVTAQQKDLARSDLVDSYNIGKRERAAAAEKIFNEEDGRLYSAFSAFVDGRDGGISTRMIDGAKIPVERKMYWRSQLEQAENIKKWYDGYHFGAFDVYCPWDVMNYLLELQRNPKAKPISYWKNTSDNAIIRSFIDYAGSTITNKLEILMAGGCIVQRVDESLTYDYLHSSEDNLWSTLYLTGYLTKAREEDYKGELPDGMVALMIPNAEIKEISFLNSAFPNPA